MRTWKKSRFAFIIATTFAALSTATPATASCFGGAHGTLEPRQPSAHSVVYRTEIVIQASPEQVWEVMTNLDEYGDWNPWVTKAEGTVEPGGRLKLDATIFGRTMHMKHTVLVVEPPRRFCWKDAGVTSILAYGQRCRTLQEQEDGSVRFTQEVITDGPFKKLIDRIAGQEVIKGLLAETAAMQQRAEQLQKKSLK